MSVWKPCKKCGLFISKGIGEDIICYKCSKDDSKKTPKSSLSDIDRDKWDNKTVKHHHYGRGKVKSFVASECTVKFGKSTELIIDPNYLKVVE